jgi:uncharacterized protein
MRNVLPALFPTHALAALLCLAPAITGAQTPADSSYDKADVMIPTRDGVKLHTIIFTPKNATTPLPIMLLRTPYGIDGRTPAASYVKELWDDGYIMVYQDIRGRYKSEGTFVMQRKPRQIQSGVKQETPTRTSGAAAAARKKAEGVAIDESTDTYDSIEWLIHNVKDNNGRVGQLGISYDGWLTAMSMLDPHPALKAVSPQASPADMFLGDDFHHNGAFRLSYGFEYATMMETSKENEAFAFDKPDTYDWYLSIGALSNVNSKYLHGKIPTWNDYVTHPNYDWFWQKQAFAPYLTRVTVPTLNVAGWWDQEDFYGPIKIYQLLEKHDVAKKNFLVVGPWNHGGWAGPGGSKLGDIEFGMPASDYFRKNIQAPFFAYYLKDKGTLQQPEAVVFQTGTNRWVDYNQWPPVQRTTPKKLYFRANGSLSFDAPSADETSAYDSYVSDPSNPVPYRKRPIQPTYGPGSTWYTWLVQDQRFLEGRPDVLSYKTEPLAEDIVVTGDIAAQLIASTSGSDSDWIVKLIDVYPDQFPADARMAGYQLMVANEVLRGRFKNLTTCVEAHADTAHKTCSPTFINPVPLVPNQPTRFTIDLHHNSHVFQRGHRIMVQVQSTWFPLIDRNPQTFVPNIFLAKDSDYKSATQRVYRSAHFASHVVIPVEMR